MRLGQLPYVRQIEYLSPSALVTYETEPVRFYLERLGPIESRPPREPQGFPAAVGTAFDALVKVACAETLGVEWPCKSLAEMLENITATDADAALTMGRELLRQYSECGALKALLLQRPRDFDRRLEGFLDGDTVDPVPLRGYLDASIEGGIHDWKVIGANAPGSRSPTPGYEVLYGFDGNVTGPHKRFGEPLEALSEKWAAQLTTYGWLLGYIGPIKASIHEVVCGRGVACFRATISEDFQTALRVRYRDAWAAVHEERVVNERLAGVGLDYVRTLKEIRRW